MLLFRRQFERILGFLCGGGQQRLHICIRIQDHVLQHRRSAGSAVSPQYGVKTYARGTSRSNSPSQTPSIGIIGQAG